MTHHNLSSVARQPVFAVATCSVLLLAGLSALDPERTSNYLPLPKWCKKNTTRASILDLIAARRKEIYETAISDGEHSQFCKNTAKNGALYAHT